MLGEQGHAKVTLLKLHCVCDLPVRCLGAEPPASSNGEGSGPTKGQREGCEPLLKEGKASRVGRCHRVT